MAFLFLEGKYHNGSYGIKLDYCIELCINNLGIDLMWIGGVKRQLGEFFQVTEIWFA